MPTASYSPATNDVAAWTGRASPLPEDAVACPCAASDGAAHDAWSSAARSNARAKAEPGLSWLGWPTNLRTPALSGAEKQASTSST